MTVKVIFNENQCITDCYIFYLMIMLKTNALQIVIYFT